MAKPQHAKDKSSKWLHLASPPIKTIIWCCFASVDAVVWRSEEKANKKEEEQSGVESALN